MIETHEDEGEFKEWQARRTKHRQIVKYYCGLRYAAFTDC